jgi:CheY-like chemotaxis protein
MSQFTILVADDNRDAAEALAELLRALGHHAIAGYDGVHAIALFDLAPEKRIPC